MKVLNAQQAFVEAVTKDGADLPAEMLANAESRRAGLAQVKTDIDSRLMVAHTNLDEAKALIKSNLQNTDNPKGVFTGEEKEYMDCLQLGHVKLENLIRKDEAHWEENYIMVQRQAQEIQEQFKQLMDKQQKEI